MAETNSHVQHILSITHQTALALLVTTNLNRLTSAPISSALEAYGQ